MTVKTSNPVAVVGACASTGFAILSLWRDACMLKRAAEQQKQRQVIAEHLRRKAG